MLSEGGTDSSKPGTGHGGGPQGFSSTMLVRRLITDSEEPLLVA